MNMMGIYAIIPPRGLYVIIASINQLLRDTRKETTPHTPPALTSTPPTSRSTDTPPPHSRYVLIALTAHQNLNLATVPFFPNWRIERTKMRVYSFTDEEEG